MSTAAISRELGTFSTRSISRVRYTSALTVWRSSQGIRKVLVATVIAATASRCGEPSAMPSRTAESVSSSDCAMKSCSDARTWRVATTPKAVSRNSAPVRASRAKMTGKGESCTSPIPRSRTTG